MEKSTHSVEIVPVVLEKHPNADSLSVVKVFGYTCCCRTADWQGISLAAYLPPDSIADVTRPEFAFLLDQSKDGFTARIKAKKLRGIVSFGLLVPAPEGAKLGEDWAERLGVKHYEPPLENEKGGGFTLGGEVASPPQIFHVKYDVDAFRRHYDLFVPGEPVVVTEKLDGANSRFVYFDGQMHAGSRTEWKKPVASFEHLTVESLVAKGMDEAKAKDIVERKRSQPQKKTLWWEVLDRTPALMKFCQDNPGTIVYGEIFGNVNCIKYGLPQNEFRAFDLLQNGHWVDYLYAEAKVRNGELPWAPRLHDTVSIPYDFDTICAMSEGTTLVPGAKPGVIREGVVVKPLNERWDKKAGRICFKCVSGAYLEKYR